LLEKDRHKKYKSRQIANKREDRHEETKKRKEVFVGGEYPSFS
jgi:hypothetical protein